MLGDSKGEALGRQWRNLQGQNRNTAGGITTATYL